MSPNEERRDALVTVIKSAITSGDEEDAKKLHQFANILALGMTEQEIDAANAIAMAELYTTIIEE